MAGLVPLIPVQGWGQRTPVTPSISPLVAIIILNYNGTEDTHACVESCLGLTYHNYRIIVVDNGSDDPSVGDLLGKFPDVELLQTGENLGYAGGNNVGIRHALEGGVEFVFVLNNDAFVDSGVLTELVGSWSKLSCCGCLGCKIVLKDDPRTLQHLGGRVVKAPFGVAFIGDGEPDNVSTEPIETDCNSGCALFTSREVLKAHGGFDESLFLYCEDDDFGLRLRKNGLRNYCVPSALVFHRVSGSQEGGRHPLRYYYTARNRLCVAQRYFPDYPIEQVESELRGWKQNILGTGYWLRKTAARFIEKGITDFHRGVFGRRDDVHIDFRNTLEWRWNAALGRVRVRASRLIARLRGRA